MLKKWTACLLALAIVAQTSPSAFAQSEPRSEMKSVQECLNEQFRSYVENDIQSGDKNPGNTLYITTSQERLKFSKILTQVILDINKENLDRLKATSLNTKIFLATTAMFAYYFHTKSKKISTYKASLETFLKNNRYNGQVLAKHGGEAEIQEIINKLTKPSQKIKLITRTAVGLFAFQMLIAVAASFNYMKKRNSLSSTPGTIDDLFASPTETDFYLILASDEPLMQTIRQNILWGCDVTENEKQEIKNTVQNLEKISPQQFEKELQTFVQ